jgi:HJR/Mrr/RecB family endonuclease
MSQIKRLHRFHYLVNCLSPIEFENFVYDLISNSQQFQPAEKYSGGPDLGSDITATEKKGDKSIKWMIQIKMQRIIGVDVINQLVAFKKAYSNKYDELKLLLVTSGNVPDKTKEFAKKKDVEIWDIYKLYEFITPDLEQKYFAVTFKNDLNKIKIEDKASSLIKSLQNIRPGREEWVKFQKISSDILEYLFCPPLESPHYELSDFDIRNRRDMIFENSSEHEFWNIIRNIYNGFYIVVDAKNYAKALNKKPVIELSHYLKPYGCGMFGILTSRKGGGESALHAAKEQWIGNQKMIVILSDEDMYEMLKIKSSGGKSEEIIRKRIADFRMSL